MSARCPAPCEQAREQRIDARWPRAPRILEEPSFAAVVHGIHRVAALGERLQHRVGHALLVDDKVRDVHRHGPRVVRVERRVRVRERRRHEPRERHDRLDRGAQPLSRGASGQRRTRSRCASRTRRLRLPAERHHAAVDVDPLAVADDGDLGAVIVVEMHAVVLGQHAPHAEECAPATADRLQRLRLVPHRYAPGACAGGASRLAAHRYVVGVGAGGASVAGPSLPVSNANGGYSSTSDAM